MNISVKDFAHYFDHTILLAATTSENLEKICADAMAYGFHSMAVNIGLAESCAAAFLKGSKVRWMRQLDFRLGLPPFPASFSKPGRQSQKKML